MATNTLTITNFKRFPKLEIRLHQDLVIFGPNGSGKTQVLWGLLLYFRAHNLRVQGSKYIDQETFTLSKEIAKLLCVQQMNELTSYLSFAHQHDGHAGNVTFCANTEEHGSLTFTLRANSDLQLKNLPSSDVFQPKEKIRFALLTIPFMFIPDDKEVRVLSETLNTGRPHLRGSYHKLHSGSKQAIDGYINRLFPNIVGLVQACDLDPARENDFSLRCKYKNGTYGVEVMYEGAAFQKILSSFIMIFALKQAVESVKYLLVEEPESFLYPSLVHIYFAALKEITSKNNIHLIVTTNSAAILAQTEQGAQMGLFHDNDVASSLTTSFMWASRSTDPHFSSFDHSDEI
eukprot:GILJ01004407.1.p1 GENE.GILJ01004407.1~~GILJ01004407.1.p1  ORF type:complete len:346 (-),score=32.39 GILJ01004407.1:86-1123(-)